MTTDDERTHIQELIKAKEARLKQREIQESLYGLAVDPSIPIEIKELRQEIAKLNYRLKRYSSASSTTLNKQAYSAVVIKEELLHNQELIKAKAKRLKVLEQQADKHGVHVQAHIQLEINDTKAAIKELEAKIKKSNSETKNNSNPDEASGCVSTFFIIAFFAAVGIYGSKLITETIGIESALAFVLIALFIGLFVAISIGWIIYVTTRRK